MSLFGKIFGEKKMETDFLPSADLLSEEIFWELIHSSYTEAAGNFDDQQNALSRRLQQLPLQDLIAFDNRFKQLHGKAYSWSILGAITIIYAGLSKESFVNFRDWIIAQGKDFYSKTIADPESLAVKDPEELEIDLEGTGYIASKIFETRTGKKIPSLFSENMILSGKEWKEEISE